MGMANPSVGEPLDKLVDHFKEGQPFFLVNIRTVEANTKDYGKGEMVVLRVRGHERELGVWGAYLLAQAKSADSSDLNNWYVVNRRHIEGFGKGRPVKVLDRVPEPEGDTSRVAAPAQATMDDDDIPF